MLDLLAAISSVDPPAALAWLVLLFAAGMYPVGMMLGSSCSACCAPCTACAEGALPDTLTVTLDNYPGEYHGPALCGLSFSACHGSGATGFATEPGGYFDATTEHASNVGPLSAVTLSGGGSGYAILGRVAPTLTATASTGSGAELTVILSTAKDGCGLDYWSVGSITIDKGGLGAVEGTSITIALGEEDTVAAFAVATLHIERTIPTLTATPTVGSGAALTVTMRIKNDYGGAPMVPSLWEIDEITFSAPGSGYEDESFATIVLGGDTTEVSPGYVLIKTVRTAPTLAAFFWSGEGATLTLNLVYIGYPGKAWSINSVTVNNGGTGYTNGDLATIVLGLNDHLSDAANEYSEGSAAHLVAVVADGVITSVTVEQGGGYYKGIGAIESVVAAWAGGGNPDYPETFQRGEYYGSNGAIASISIESGGAYYHSSAEAEPYVAAVTVGISQTSPSNGTGAVIAAVVEGNTSSADFGKIKTLSVSAGGSGYLAWEWVKTCCDDRWNGVPIVLKRYLNNSGNPCEYTHRMCGGYSNMGSRGKIALQYNGPSSPATITMTSEIRTDGSGGVATECNVTIQSDSSITDCGDWSEVTFSGTDPYGYNPMAAVVTATVEAGGEYDANFLYDADCPYCESCCQGTDTPPSEVTVVFAVSGAGEAYAQARAAAGTYVLSGDCGSMYYTYSSGAFFGSFVVSLSSCKNDGCNTCISKCKTSISVPHFFRPVPGMSGGSPQIGLADSRNCCTMAGYAKAAAIIHNTSTPPYPVDPWSPRDWWYTVPTDDCLPRQLCNNLCTDDTPICGPQPGSYSLSAYNCNEMYTQTTASPIEPYYTNVVSGGTTVCDHTNGFAAWARGNKLDNVQWLGIGGWAGVYGYGVAPANTADPNTWRNVSFHLFYPSFGGQVGFDSQAARDAFLDGIDTYTPSSWKDVATLTIQ